MGRDDGTNSGNGTGDSAREGLDWLKDGTTDSADVATYYDDWAGTYDATLETWNYQAPDRAADTLCELLTAGARVLDVGCGTGLFGRALSQRLNCRIEGLDISQASLDVADKLGVYERLQRHDLQITPLPAADDAFDAAACVGVLTYIENTAGLLADLCRAVHPGGHILFTQRDDRWAEKDFDSLIANLEKRGLWTPVSISEPMPYLPGNEDFGDSIRVIQVLCQVI
jgi:predicted TPR repeat methyltransferase